MRTTLLFLALIPLTACSTGQTGAEPSLSYRPAEAVDPRVPVNTPVVIGSVDPELAALLAAAITRAEAGQAEFDVRAAAARRLAPGAGAQGSESWIAAQAALSRLIEQQGVATNAAADVDSYAGERLNDARWIAQANQNAINDAATRIGRITASQRALIDQLNDQLTR